jgi:hypothetical protein
MLVSLAKCRMVSADAEYAKTAQQVEITSTRTVEQILALAAAKADVISDGAQHANHHLVQVAGVKSVALGFSLRKQRRDVERRVCRLGRSIESADIAHRQPSDVSMPIDKMEDASRRPAARIAKRPRR